MQVIKHFTDKYEQIFASVSIDTKQKFLMCSWRKPSSSPEQTELIHYCEETAKSLNLKYALSDVTACQKQAQNRIQLELLECLSHAGLQKVALVNRELKGPLEESPEGIEVMMFHRLPLAIAWFFLPVVGNKKRENSESVEF